MLLLAAICIIAIKILSILIYQEESKNLQDSWVENIGNNIIYFAAIPIK